MKHNMHIKEDITKPENRINISLFHLLMNREFREYILTQLNLKKECIIYPPSNIEGGNRPDLAIELNDDVVGYIEVEIGKDEAQKKRYEEESGKKVYSIYGKKEYGGDFSLEEIYDFSVKLQKNIKTNTEITVEKVNDTSKNVVDQEEAIIKSQKIFSNIIDSVNELNSGVGEIFNNISKINTMKDSVVVQVAKLSVTLEETAAGSEEVASLSEEVTKAASENTEKFSELGKAVNNLEEQISEFKI